MALLFFLQEKVSDRKLVKPVSSGTKYRGLWSGVLSLVLFAAIVCHVLEPVIQYCTYCLFAAFYPRKNEVCELLLRATENMRSLLIQLK